MIIMTMMDKGKYWSQKTTPTDRNHPSNNRVEETKISIKSTVFLNFAAFLSEMTLMLIKTTKGVCRGPSETPDMYNVTRHRPERQGEYSITKR